MTTSKLTVDEGAQTPLATYEITEDAEQKQLSRTVLNDDAGNEIQPLTDAQLRAAPVPVDTGLAPQTDALTDTELRATPVPVSGPLTDAQLRATAVPVDTGLTQPTTPADTQPISATALPLPAGAATAANQQTDALTDAQLRATPVPVDTGLSPQADALTDAELRAAPVPVSGPLTDAELRAAAVPVDGSGVTQPVSAASLPLPTGAATAANQQTDALTDTELRAAPVPVSNQHVTGQLRDPAGAALTVKTASVAVSSLGANTFIAAVAGKKIRVLAYRIQANGANTEAVAVWFIGTSDETSIPGTPQWWLDKREGVVATAYPGAFEFESGSGEGVRVNLHVAQTVRVVVQYVEV